MGRHPAYRYVAWLARTHGFTPSAAVSEFGLAPATIKKYWNVVPPTDAACALQDIYYIGGASAIKLICKSTNNVGFDEAADLVSRVCTYTRKAAVRELENG